MVSCKKESSMLTGKNAEVLGLGRTDDGGAVHDLKPETGTIHSLSLKPKGDPASCIMVQERGFLVLTGIPRPMLGESCTTSIKDFAIYTPHKKKSQT